MDENLHVLRTYLQIVYELESSVFQQHQLINYLEERCNIGNAPIAVKNQSNTSSILGGVLLCILSTICFIGPFILFCIGLGNKPVCLVLSLIFIPVGIYLGIKSVQKAKEFFEDISDIARINNRNNAEFRSASIDYRRRLIERQMILSELPGLKYKVSNTHSLLNEYYALDVIHKDYRSLIPISSINKYLQTGICNTLEGVNGAYSRYEYERQMNIIIDRLGTVISQLNSIRRTQELLYNAVQESNRISYEILCSIRNHADQSLHKLDQINGRLTSIDKNLYITNYTNNLIRKEIAYRNWLTYGATYNNWHH